MSKIGDWHCPNCNFNIFRNKDHCFKCNAKRPPVQAQAQTPINPAYASLQDQVLHEVREMEHQRRAQLISKAISEGLPKLYYVTRCPKCKETNDRHNCRDYMENDRP
jgi:hypothetical protein